MKEGFQDADTLAKLRASSVLQEEIEGIYLEERRTIGQCPPNIVPSIPRLHGGTMQ